MVEQFLFKMPYIERFARAFMGFGRSAKPAGCLGAGWGPACRSSADDALKGFSKEEGAAVSIWESGALLWGDWTLAMGLGLQSSDTLRDCSLVT